MRIEAGRRLARGVVAAALVAMVLAAAGTVPVAAGVPVGTRIEGRTSQPIVGLRGTRMSISVSHFGVPSARIGLTLRTRNAAKTAWAEDSWTLDGGSVTCTVKLSSCTIDDGGGFGTYGRVDLTFASTRPVVARDLTCFGSDVVYAKQTRRAGVLTGTVRLETKSAKLGTIRNGSGTHRIRASIPITMRRTTYTGALCPSDDDCLASAWLNGQDYRVTGYRLLPTGKGRVGFVRPLSSAVPAVGREWYVDAKGPGADALKLSTANTLAAATILTTLAAPFVTGTVGFTATTPATADTFLGCDVASRTGDLEVDIVWHLPGRAKVPQVETVVATLLRTPS